MKELRKAMPAIIILILFVVGTMLILMPSMVAAKLSDETLEEVDKLWWKHHGLSVTGNVLFIDTDFVYEWWNIYFDDGILYVET